MAAKKAEKKPAEKKAAKPAAKKKAVKPVVKAEKVEKAEKKNDGLVFPDDLGNDWPYYRPVQIVRAKKMSEKAKLANGDVAQPGDYIVFNGSSFSVVAEAEFDRDYTPVPPAKRDTHFNQIA